MVRTLRSAEDRTPLVAVFLESKGLGCNCLLLAPLSPISCFTLLRSPADICGLHAAVAWGGLHEFDRLHVCILHAFCMHSACILHAFCMHSACILITALCGRSPTLRTTRLIPSNGRWHPESQSHQQRACNITMLARWARWKIRHTDMASILTTTRKLDLLILSMPFHNIPGQSSQKCPRDLNKVHRTSLRVDFRSGRAVTGRLQC